jgi:DNA helicase IV
MTDELAREQAVLDAAHASLAAMRSRVQATFDRLQANGGFHDLDHEVALRRRIAVLGDSPRPLVFGRTDAEGARGERWYIGRRHVEDATGDPVVVEWRTRVAEPFYRARPADPIGLARRRHLMVDGRTLVSYSDDVFGDGAARFGDVRIRGGDALMAELERARTGQMLDIVATIQVEQDEVIRAPLEGVLAVQGGPGTGKTAIGLHRAAYLLYHHPELARSEVLVLGPSRTFLGYIAQVLPSLGEEAVVQMTVADLVPSARVRADESLATRRVKADARMAVVLANALVQRRSSLADPVVVRVGRTRVVVTPDEVDEMVAIQADRGVPYNVGRAALRAQLVSLIHRRHGMVAADPEGVRRAIRADAALRSALDIVWPAVPAAALVRTLLSDPTVLARAADGVLDADEQRALLRPARAPLTAGDLALLDEARALLDGHTSTYGHVVADEAQDLSPMELRMIARRAPAGSVTLLGDLAQATGAWHHASWAEVAAHLATPNGWRQTELTLGYRAPAPVLELASRLLPVAAPEVGPTEAVRRGAHPVAVVHVADGDVFAAAVRETVARRDDGELAACIVAPEHVEAAVRAFARAGVPVGVPDRHGIARPITVVAAPTAKGLEFDAAVVVEPAAIAGDDARGLRLLYVALTRPIQRLVLVHARPLPPTLVAQD